jgi:hypothetical protein
MKKLVMATAAAVAFAFAGAAQAAPILTFDGTSGTFGDASVTESPFSRSFDFNVGTPGFLSLTISSTRTEALNDIDFSNVTINGVNFAVLSTGVNEIRFRNNVNAIVGVNTILVEGVSGGNASFAGTITFSDTPAAIPEPATWAMMILGMGTVGFALRRRRELAVA